MRMFDSHLPFQQIKTDLKVLCEVLRVNKVLIKAVSHQSALFPLEVQYNISKVFSLLLRSIANSKCTSTEQ